MKKLNYSQALEELEEIVSEIENENISVDELSGKVKRAAELIRICKAVLHQTENEVNAVFKELQDGLSEQ
ncbi:exodeoxyribonuclease VII small subunit [Candidatus Sulfidibacterium hydrothermale]|uniref:exodeoxyribonuclease VII small subunit n=1 Tax=Candidatus Sulfidibacterium hydrothermale TaxID=2875962 RepID=UPI001F0B2AEE|nr:exodeoxyribonuclease VII small subunit [Candidatus Sulfidibacterium hydrothermale]UBM62877.1 exodeoxyribonuclease VII small subunit [Candidatus Sulfidibacterium hydrothermale]